MNPLGRVLHSFEPRRAFSFLALSAVCILCAGAAAAGTYPHARTGWLAGLGLGGGSAAIKIDGVSSDRESGGAGFFRVGYGFNDRVSLELNSNGWTKSENGGRLTFTANTAAVNYYPGSTGLVLRGGLGYGSAKASSNIGSTTVSAEENGFAFNAGSAYEFRVTQRFALGPQVDFGWTSLDSFDANWFNFGLGLNWYFVPKQ